MDLARLGDADALKSNRSSFVTILAVEYLFLVHIPLYISYSLHSIGFDAWLFFFWPNYSLCTGLLGDPEMRRALKHSGV